MLACSVEHAACGHAPFDLSSGLAYDPSLSEVCAMKDGMMIPTYNQPICTAGQVATILGKPRPTVGGWISRYPALRLQQVASGATRMFSPADLGKLVALRLAISASNMTDPLFQLFDLVQEEIGAEFDRLIGQVRQEEWGAKGSRPYLPVNEDEPLRLVARDGVFVPMRGFADASSHIADLSGFQLPETTLFLGQGLRNAWTRMLIVLNGVAIDD